MVLSSGETHHSQAMSRWVSLRGWGKILAQLCALPILRAKMLGRDLPAIARREKPGADRFFHGREFPIGLVKLGFGDLRTDFDGGRESSAAVIRN